MTLGLCDDCPAAPPPPPLGVSNCSVSNDDEAALPPTGAMVTSPSVLNVAVAPSLTVALFG